MKTNTITSALYAARTAVLVNYIGDNAALKHNANTKEEIVYVVTYDDNEGTLGAVPYESFVKGDTAGMIKRPIDDFCLAHVNPFSLLIESDTDGKLKLTLDNPVLCDFPAWVAARGMIEPAAKAVDAINEEGAHDIGRCCEARIDVTCLPDGWTYVAERYGRGSAESLGFVLAIDEVMALLNMYCLGLNKELVNKNKSLRSA
ncbi:MAG: hypothetical protein RR382_00510 [Tannerellaceae bacterium]